MNAVQSALANDMSEKALLAHVRNAAKKLGWLCYHTHRSDRSEAGFPDLVLIRNGRIIFMELKVEDLKKGKIKDDQQRWIDALLEVCGKNHQIFVMVCRPSNWLSGFIEQLLTPAAGAARGGA